MSRSLLVGPLDHCPGYGRSGLDTHRSVLRPPLCSFVIVIGGVIHMLQWRLYCSIPSNRIVLANLHESSKTPGHCSISTKKQNFVPDERRCPVLYNSHSYCTVDYYETAILQNSFVRLIFISERARVCSFIHTLLLPFGTKSWFSSASPIPMKLGVIMRTPTMCVSCVCKKCAMLVVFVWIISMLHSLFVIGKWG